MLNKKTIVFGKLIFLGVILLFTGSIPFFSGAALGAEVVEVNLPKAINLALENALELKIADLSYQNARLDYKKTQANNLLTGSKYLEIQSELNLAQAEESFLQAENQVVISTITEYLKILQEEKDQTITKKQLTLEERLLEEIKVQVERGHKSELELLKQTNKYHNARLNYQKVKAAYNQNSKELKIKLGIISDFKISSKELAYPQIGSFSEETILNKTLESSFNLKLKKEQIELARVDLERAQASSTPELDLMKLENNLKKTELEYQKEKAELETTVQSLFFSYQQAIDNLELSEQNLIEAVKNHQIIEKQNQVGLTTVNDLLSADISLLQAEYNQLSAIINYYSNLLQIKSSMGESLRGITDEIVIH